MTAQVNIDEIQRRILDSPGLEHLVQGPGKYDFYVTALGERKPVGVTTGAGIYDLFITGIDWLGAPDAWLFRGVVTRKRPALPTVGGSVEGIIRLKPDKNLLRGCFHFVESAPEPN